MTRSEIRQRAREQGGSQFEADAGDDALLDGYINEGLNELYGARYRCEAAPLTADGDAPELPDFYHGALADYATWRALSNGGSASQARAQFFYARFQMARASVEVWLDGRSGLNCLRNKY